MFAGNFAPRGWALADGQLLAISQNDALFSLFGTIYGGDGRTTFGLPDLRGRIPIHQGAGPGLSPRPIGSKGGEETVTVTGAQLPPHTHPAQASSDTGNTANPGGGLPARSTAVDFYINEAPSVPMAVQAITATGGNQAHGNIAPFQCINYIVALFGIYPSRN
jgi:microcystin-dependent protein